MKVSYPNGRMGMKNLADFESGECFKCRNGLRTYMKVHLVRIPGRDDNCTYAIDIETGAVYPFEYRPDYLVIPLDAEVLIKEKN